MRHLPLKIGAITIKKGKFSQPRSHKREEAELEEAFQQVTSAANATRSDYSAAVYGTDDAEEDLYAADTEPRSSKKTIIIVISCIVALLAIAVSLGIWWFMRTTEDDGLIYSNVHAAGVDLSGMTQAQAADAIRAATDAYAQTDLLVNLPDSQLILTPADTGVSVDTDKMAADAFAYGRSGNRWENFQAKTDATLTSYSLELSDYLTLNEDYIRQALDQWASESETTLTQSTATINGEVPALDRTIEEATADETVVHMTMTIMMGSPEKMVDTESLYEAILNAYNSGDFTPISTTYHMIEPDPVDLQALYTQYCTQPVDAVLDEETYTVTPETLGYGFSIEDAQPLVDAAGYGEEVTIEFDFIAPEVTLMSLDQYLYQDELAKFSSDHVNNSNRTRNLELACEAINGTIIRPGEVFSFNEIVGQRTSDKGYKPASVYVSSETVSEVGGGICQVASTIYYCALMADMEIVEREEHQFLVDYVPPGMDATIYWGSYDFKFRNNTKYPIRIDASTHDGQCHIVIIGTDDKDYYVEMTYELISGPHYGGEEEVEFTEDNNPKNYYDGQVIQTAYTGYTYRTYRNKYSKSTDELISTEEEAVSVFSSRARKVAKLVEKEEETQPSESTDPTSETPSTQAPSTDAPSTEPPTTEAPVTEPSTSESTETTAPTTETSEATDAPAPESTETDPPASESSEPAA